MATTIPAEEYDQITKSAAPIQRRGVTVLPPNEYDRLIGVVPQQPEQPTILGEAAKGLSIGGRLAGAAAGAGVEAFGQKIATPAILPQSDMRGELDAMNRSFENMGETPLATTQPAPQVPVDNPFLGARAAAQQQFRPDKPEVQPAYTSETTPYLGPAPLREKVARIAGEIGTQIPNMAATTAGFFAAGPAGAGTVGALLEGASQYGEALDRGETPERALDEAAKFAPMVGVLNAIPFAEKVTRFLPDSVAAKIIGGTVLRGALEGGTEMSEGGAAAIAQMKEAPKSKEEWQQAISNAAQGVWDERSVFAVSALMGGAMTAPVTAKDAKGVVTQKKMQKELQAGAPPVVPPTAPPVDRLQPGPNAPTPVQQEAEQLLSELSTPTRPEEIGTPRPVSRYSVRAQDRPYPGQRPSVNVPAPDVRATVRNMSTKPEAAPVSEPAIPQPTPEQLALEQQILGADLVDSRDIPKPDAPATPKTAKEKLAARRDARKQSLIDTTMAQEADAPETQISKIDNIVNSIAPAGDTTIRNGKNDIRRVVYDALGIVPPAVPDTVTGMVPPDDMEVRIGESVLSNRTGKNLESPEVMDAITQSVMRKDMEARGIDPERALGPESGLNDAQKGLFYTKAKAEAKSIVDSIYSALPEAPTLPASPSQSAVELQTQPEATQTAPETPKAVEAPVKQPWEMTRDEFSNGDGVIFHGSRTKNINKLQPGEAQQAGNGIYFGTDKKYIDSEFGLDGETYPAKLNPDAKVVDDSNGRTYTNAQLEASAAWKDRYSKKWDNVEDAWSEDANFVNAVYRENGVDAVVLGDAAGDYGTETIVLNPDAVITHRQIVKDAIESGRQVPPEVLADYPDLAPKAEFVGLQERPRGQAPIALYNIPTPTGGMTSVSADTARAQGFSVPEPPVEAPSTPAQAKEALKQRMEARKGPTSDTIRTAALDLTGGAVETRVRLADLREKLGGTREQQDAALLDMQKNGEVVLMRNDDPQDITPRDEAAKLMMGGDRRDLVYLKPQAAPEPVYSPETQAVDTPKPAAPPKSLPELKKAKDRVDKHGLTKEQMDYLTGEIQARWDKLPLKSPDNSAERTNTSEVIKVPGDGTFIIESQLAANAIHKRLTGKWIDESSAKEIQKSSTLGPVSKSVRDSSPATLNTSDTSIMRSDWKEKVGDLDALYAKQAEEMARMEALIGNQELSGIGDAEESAVREIVQDAVKGTFVEDVTKKPDFPFPKTLKDLEGFIKRNQSSLDKMYSDSPSRAQGQLVIDKLSAGLPRVRAIRRQALKDAAKATPAAVPTKPASPVSAAAQVDQKEQDAINKAFERILKLNGVEQRSDNVYYVPDKLMTVERGRSLKTQKEKERMTPVHGRSTDKYEIVYMSELTGVSTDRGYALRVLRQAEDRAPNVEQPAQPLTAAANRAAMPEQREGTNYEKTLGAIGDTLKSNKDVVAKQATEAQQKVISLFKSGAENAGRTPTIQTLNNGDVEFSTVEGPDRIVGIRPDGTQYKMDKSQKAIEDYVASETERQKDMPRRVQEQKEQDLKDKEGTYSDTSGTRQFSFRDGAWYSAGEKLPTRGKARDTQSSVDEMLRSGEIKKAIGDTLAGNKGVVADVAPAVSDMETVKSIVRSINGDPWVLAGPRLADKRQSIMSTLTGKKVPKAQSGVTAIRDELRKIAGIPANASGYTEQEMLKEWASTPSEASPVPTEPAALSEQTPAERMASVMDRFKAGEITQEEATKQRKAIMAEKGKEKKGKNSAKEDNSDYGAGNQSAADSTDSTRIKIPKLNSGTTIQQTVDMFPSKKAALMEAYGRSAYGLPHAELEAGLKAAQQIDEAPKKKRKPNPESGFLNIGAAVGGIKDAISTLAGDKPFLEFHKDLRDAKDLNVRRTGDAAAIVREAEQALADLTKAWRDSVGGLTVKVKQMPDVLRQQINEYMSEQDPAKKSQLLAAFPPNLQQPTQHLREMVDAASRRLLSEGVATGATAEIIQENEGTYLRRTYRIFKDKDFKNKIPDAVKERVRKWLENEHSDIASQPNGAQEIQKMLNSLINIADSTEPVVIRRGKKLGTKDLSTLMKRNDFPQEILDLWGVEKDGVVNFLETMTSMAHMIANHKFYREVAKAGEGKYVFSKEYMDNYTTGDNPAYDKMLANNELVPWDENSTKKQNVRPATETGPYGAMQGSMVHRDFKKAMQDAVKIDEVAPWVANLNTINSWMKMGKTVFSPTTQSLNMLSNTYIALANGHLLYGNPAQTISRMRQAIGMASTELTSRHNPKWRELGNRAVQLRVMGDTDTASELMALRGESKRNTINKGTRELVSKIDPRFEKAIDGLGYMRDIAIKLYQGGDDVWKAFAWLTETQHLQDAGMSKVKAEEEAALRIRRMYPTYTETSNLVQKARRFPVAGPFVSFVSEMPRNSINTLMQTQLDLRSDNPKVRAMGIRRASGIIASIGSAYAAQMIGRMALDMDDDDEKALRNGLPPWDRNSLIGWDSFDRKKGVAVGQSLSRMNPYGVLFDPVNAFLRAEGPGSGLVAASEQIADPFISEEIGFKTIRQQLQNLDDYNNPIVLESDPMLEKFWKRAAAAWKIGEVGGVASARRIMADDNPAKRAFQEATGQRIVKVDMTKSLRMNAFEFQRQSSEPLKDVRAAVKSGDKAAVREQYDQYLAAHRKGFEALHDMAAGMVRIGVSKRDIIKTLDEAGVSEENRVRIIKGKYKEPAMRPDVRKALR